MEQSDQLPDGATNLSRRDVEASLQHREGRKGGGGQSGGTLKTIKTGKFDWS